MINWPGCSAAPVRPVGCRVYFCFDGGRMVFFHARGYGVRWRSSIWTRCNCDCIGDGTSGGSSRKKTGGSTQPAVREVLRANRAVGSCVYRKLKTAVFTFPAVPRSTQPSTLCGTVNEYQLSGW